MLIKDGVSPMNKENNICSADKQSSCHMTSIGGQAVLEGVMMRGPKKIATAVRKSNGEIIIDLGNVSETVTKHKLNKIPILRGVVNFFASLVTGTKCLMFSADQFDIEDDTNESSRFEKWLEEKLGDKIKDITIYFSVIIALIFSIGLFMMLPHFISSLVGNFIKNTVILNAVEGISKMVIFTIYILLVSQMKDIQRVFEYHGAEHKSIACYESGMELTPENAAKCSRLHPRCGTSFLLIVMIISIIFYACLPWQNTSFVLRIIYRLLLLPVVAGTSYEILKFAGKSNNRIVKALTKPGLFLQKLTTREPDESQIEVAIAALSAVLTGNKEDDKW